MNNWNDTTVALLSATHATPINIPAKELSLTGADADFYLPIVAFVTSNGNMWIGPQQTYYYEDGSSVTGVYFTNQSQMIEWFESATFAGQSTAGINNNADLVSFLDNQVQLSELEDAAKPENCTIVATDLRRCFADDWFFATEEYSSLPGMMNLTDIEVENSDIRFEIENETSSRTGTVWIGAGSQAVVQASENGTTTFPGSGGF